MIIERDPQNAGDNKTNMFRTKADFR